MNGVTETVFQRVALSLGMLTREQQDFLSTDLGENPENDSEYAACCLKYGLLNEEQVRIIRDESTKYASERPGKTEPVEKLFDGTSEDFNPDLSEESVFGYRLGLLAFEQGMMSKVDYIESYYAHKYAYSNMPFEAYLIDKDHLTVEQVNHLKDLARDINWDEYFSRLKGEYEKENISNALKRSLDVIFSQIEQQSRNLSRMKKGAGEGEHFGDTIQLNEDAADMKIVSGKMGSGTASEQERSGTDPLDRYDIMEEIARGGMGVLFKARQLDLNRIVALKFMLAEECSSEDDRNRFFREAEALANLKHPNIVQVHDIGVSEEGYFFVMDFVEGMSLSEYMHVMGDELSIRDRIRIMLKVLDAVHYGHQLGLMHRDLKPGNIMINNQSEPVVVDFGLVEDNEALSSSVKSEDIMGTPHYMAPELIRGETLMGPSTDVFALGVVLYELLTESLPFNGDTVQDILDSITGCEPAMPRTLNRNLDPEIEAIILKALEKKPQTRYCSVYDFKKDLQRYLDNKPIEACRMPKHYYLRKYLRQNRTAALVFAGVSLCALIALVLVISLMVSHSREMKETAARERAELSRINSLNRDLYTSAEESLKQNKFREASEITGRIRAGIEQMAQIVSGIDDAPEEDEHLIENWRVKNDELLTRLREAEKEEELLKRVKESDKLVEKGMLLFEKARGMKNADRDMMIFSRKVFLLGKAGNLLRTALGIYPENEKARKRLLNISAETVKLHISAGKTGPSADQAVLEFSEYMNYEDEKALYKEIQKEYAEVREKRAAAELIQKANALYLDDDFGNALSLFSQAFKHYPLEEAELGISRAGYRYQTGRSRTQENNGELNEAFLSLLLAEKYCRNTTEEESVSRNISRLKKKYFAGLIMESLSKIDRIFSCLKSQGVLKTGSVSGTGR